MTGWKKWLCRLKILLLSQLRSPFFYLTAVLLIALQLYLGSVSLPAASNRVIGLVNGGGRYAEAVTGALLEKESAYTWKLYPSREALEDAVISGSADSGFVLDERLDVAVDRAESADYSAGSGGVQVPDLSGCIDYYVSTSSTKGAAAKESVYACLFDAISPVLVKSAIRAGVLFEDSGDAVWQRALEEMQRVAEEDTLFSVRFEIYGEEEAPADESADAEKSNLAMIAALLLFAASLLFATAKFRESSKALAIWLRKGGWIYRILEIYAPLLLTGLFLAILLFLQGLPLTSGVLLLIPVLLAAALWTSLFARLFRKEGIYLFLSVALILIAGVLTSSAGDLFFLNSVRWLRFLLPSVWIKGCLLL